MSKPRVGVEIIVVKEGKILLGKRKGAHGSGCYSPPGGNLECKETVETCAKRELDEETGLISFIDTVGTMDSRCH
jgi:8-oxo-dGTP diphosphatase